MRSTYDKYDEYIADWERLIGKEVVEKIAAKVMNDTFGPGGLLPPSKEEEVQE